MDTEVGGRVSKRTGQSVVVVNGCVDMKMGGNDMS